MFLLLLGFSGCAFGMPFRDEVSYNFCKYLLYNIISTFLYFIAAGIILSLPFTDISSKKAEIN